MVINRKQSLRTVWLNIVIAITGFELSVFLFVGIVSLGSNNFEALGLFTIAGILGYLIKELIAINITAKEVGIIIFLILGFGVNSPLSILFALQLYGLGFNEPTKELFRNYIATNKFEKLL